MTALRLRHKSNVLGVRTSAQYRKTKGHVMDRSTGDSINYTCQGN